MIRFLKNLLSKINFKSNNKQLNNFNKIIYSIIIICAIFFIGFIIFFIIKNLPAFLEAAEYTWNNSKSILENME